MGGTKHYKTSIAVKTLLNKEDQQTNVGDTKYQARATCVLLDVITITHLPGPVSRG